MHLFSFLATPNAEPAIEVSTIKQLLVGIRQDIHKLGAAARQRGGGERRLVLEIKHQELPGEGQEQYILPVGREGKSGKVERKGSGSRGRGGIAIACGLSFQPEKLSGIRVDLHLLDDDVILGVSENLDGQEESLEAKDAEMARIIGIATEAGENLRAGVVLPENAVVGVDREKGRAGNGGEDMGITASLDPAEVLDAKLGIGGGIKPDDDGAKMEVNEGDTAVAVGDGEEKVGGGGLGGEEIAGERERDPADGGDEGGEGAGRRRERDSGDELEGARVNDGDGGARSEGEETGGAEIGGSEVVAARRTWES